MSLVDHYESRSQTEFSEVEYQELNESCMSPIEFTKSERLGAVQDKVNYILEENAQLREMNIKLKVQLHLLREREKRNIINTRRLEKIIDNISSLLVDSKEVHLAYTEKKKETNFPAGGICGE